jgi:hypothetical protein
MQEVTKESDNSFLKEVRMALDEDTEENFSDWLKKNFEYPMNLDLETVDPLKRKGKVTST